MRLILWSILFSLEKKGKVLGIQKYSFDTNDPSSTTNVVHRSPTVVERSYKTRLSFNNLARASTQFIANKAAFNAAQYKSRNILEAQMNR